MRKHIRPGNAIQVRLRVKLAGKPAAIPVR